MKNEPDYAPFYKRIASRQFRDTVANLLNDPERYNRIAALQVFELLKDDNYLNRLTPLIENEHPQIRLAALHSVRSIKNRTTERLFEKMATSHEDWRIKGESLIALPQSRQPAT
ncbi:MAG: HEAT repeat domain-containing protein [Calditrichia bacterium]